LIGADLISILVWIDCNSDCNVGYDEERFTDYRDLPEIDFYAESIVAIMFVKSESNDSSANSSQSTDFIYGVTMESTINMIQNTCRTSDARRAKS